MGVEAHISITSQILAQSFAVAQVKITKLFSSLEGFVTNAMHHNRKESNQNDLL